MLDLPSFIIFDISVLIYVTDLTKQGGFHMTNSY